MGLLLNIDVPDLAEGLAFFSGAFGLVQVRRLGPGAVELAGWPVPVFLLEKASGTEGCVGSRRTYDRHWTPVHYDVVADDLRGAVARAVAHGAVTERPPTVVPYGEIAMLSDPFGHGFCLIEFNDLGYAAIDSSWPGASGPGCC